MERIFEGCRNAHRRLFATLDRLDDESVRRPSRLDSWTVGHVLTHLARNADSHVRILRAAAGGESVEQYAGGYEQRTRDIEAGAGRSRSDLVEDVRTSALALEATWDKVPPKAWDSHGLAHGRPWPCRELPFHRWREVEIHHADLGYGYEPADWPDDYVALELPRALATVDARLVDPLARRRLLAWLVGRAPQPGKGELPLLGWQERPEHYHAR